MREEIFKNCPENSRNSKQSHSKSIFVLLSSCDFFIVRFCIEDFKNI